MSTDDAGRLARALDHLTDATQFAREAMQGSELGHANDEAKYSRMARESAESAVHELRDCK